MENLFSIGERISSRQQYGKKSDSPYPMENTDNQNNTYQFAQTKLFKSGFQGASGNHYKRRIHPIRPLRWNAAEGFLVLEDALCRDGYQQPRSGE